ncbi:MAG: hypothetical protein LBR61_06685 [Synergistaceae bacterium]|jgi:hypothetical protein|nr:hypothetical protein [Synergistaceae bacterium]
MNTIRFETFKMGPFEGFPVLHHEATFVRTLIDGFPLVEIVEDYERSHLLRKLTGNYEYRYVNDYYSDLRDKKYGSVQEIGLLMCAGCLCLECSPMYCTMAVTARTVIWRDFYNPNLNGDLLEADVDYSELGPFEFDKRAFYKEAAVLEELAKDYKSHYGRLLWKRDPDLC